MDKALTCAAVWSGLLCVGSLCGSPMADAAIITATVTADNHYALYYGTESNLTFVGRNEKGGSGNPGSYNWSLPETFGALVLAEDNRFFIAQWDESPNESSLTQALLGQFVTTDGRYLATNNTEWGYFEAAPNPGTDGDAPDAAGMGALLTAASWTQPGYSTPNGTGIWSGFSLGPIPGISTQASWISRTSDSDSSYNLTVYRSITVREMQQAVPEPTSLALLGSIGLVGLLVGCRRKRRFVA